VGTDSDPYLSQLSTEWSLIFLAHGGSPEEAASAQAELMGRYAGAVHRYLLGALHDSDAASELNQEFALRFLRGDFHRADPARGRFRDFVKRSLRNLMIDHRRRSSARPRPMGDDLPEPIDRLTGDEDFDRRFTTSWRSELLDRAWGALARLEERSGQPYHTVLRMKVENPEMHSPELAEQLSAPLGRTISAGGLRMLLQRSRDRFVEFLLEEVNGSLMSPTEEELEQELIDLGLMVYCRPVLKRHGRPR
jgi:RNA polymerase sigma-70 factor (ECF subfamily)